jgi:hypothetical protein
MGFNDNKKALALSKALQAPLLDLNQRPTDKGIIPRLLKKDVQYML